MLEIIVGTHLVDGTRVKAFHNGHPIDADVTLIDPSATPTRNDEHWVMLTRNRASEASPQAAETIWDIANEAASTTPFIDTATAPRITSSRFYDHHAEFVVHAGLHDPHEQLDPLGTITVHASGEITATATLPAPGDLTAERELGPFPSFCAAMHALITCHRELLQDPAAGLRVSDLNLNQWTGTGQLTGDLAHDNNLSAVFAAVALDAFTTERATTEDPIEATAIALVTSLGHLLERVGVRLQEVLTMGEMHYHSQTTAPVISSTDGSL
ncbi:hypothetical protein GCM10010174_25920 [Kutzneria viridogrisea]|uniref:Uncharacterized protein n=1 Tax=Kutzneria viridogrisea TaxID=47990 RepID=A0ABR6BRG1_9PSEU|nr:hypothetical protein [Kutzneria viridogrisea]